VRFRYAAYDGAGQRRRGEVEAGDRQAAQERLWRQGMIVLAIDPVPEPRGWGARVSPAETAFFFRQLAAVIRTGLPVLTALELQRQGSRNPALRRVLASLADQIRAGRALWEALAQHPRTFRPLHVELVRGGEGTGRVDDALRRCARYLEDEQALLGRVRAALVYPCLVLAVGAVGTGVVMAFVMPRLQALFASFQTDLPAVTRALLALAGAVRAHGGLLGACLAALLAALWAGLGTQGGRRVRDALLLRLPLVGGVVRAAATARFARILAETLGAGLPLQQALDLAAMGLGNGELQQRVAAVRGDILDGQGLSEPLARSGALPSLFLQVLAVAERSGDLEGAMGELVSFYEAEADARMRALLAAFEPLVTVILGAGVLGFALAVVLPMFQIARLGR
jgi:type IV pilus assembly protein PilC